MTPQPLPFDVFLSYCRGDEGAVMAVEKALTELGLRVWRDDVLYALLFLTCDFLPGWRPTARGFGM